MRSSTSKKSFLLLCYPLLFGIFPLISLWAANLGQVPAFAVLRSLLFALGLLAVTCLLSLLVFRRMERAALAASLFLVLFYSFGQVYQPLKQVPWMRLSYLFVLWMLVMAAGLVLIARAKHVQPQLHTLLTVVALFLVLYPSIHILMDLPQESSPQSSTAPGTDTQENPVSRIDGPDVYYILIDNYSRTDFLKELDIDNSAFLQSLTDLGFNVDPCAQSNYDITHTSMAATLNMNYLDQLDVLTSPEGIDGKPEGYSALIKNSAVEARFKSMGYKTITFRGLFPWLNVENSDIYYDPEASTNLLDRAKSINLQNMFFRTTLLLPLTDWLSSPESQSGSLSEPVSSLASVLTPTNTPSVSGEYLSYQHNLYDFDRLEGIPKLPGKKFVYAHLFSTHLPFVFKADGSFIKEGYDTNESYKQAVEYTDTRILEIVKTILKESSKPPVIVLQSDHSYAGKVKRVHILNALYLPGAPNLHPNGMTPVNTFRIIFNHYFGADYEILPDQSYISTPKHLTDIHPVPPSCVGQ